MIRTDALRFRHGYLLWLILPRRAGTGKVGFAERLQMRYIFRGHGSVKHSLITSLERQWPFPHTEGDPTIDRMIRQYQDGLARRGHPGLDNATKFDWLEHGRHHGLPAPLLDFSWSPYVALYFALTGASQQEKDAECVVYSLAVDQLARHWILQRTTDRKAQFFDLYGEFLYKGDLPTDPFPADYIAVLPEPSRFTRRMHSQIGAFVYTTLDYPARDQKDLEGFLDAIDEEVEAQEFSSVCSSRSPTLTKVYLRYDWAKEAFSRLELMNMTGANLLGSAEGVATDIRNAYRYEPKALYLRKDRMKSPANSEIERAAGAASHLKR